MTFVSALPRRSGIYGIIRLDGGPVDPRDAAALGMAEFDDPRSFALDGFDHNDPAAIQIADNEGAITIIAGHIEAVDELAHRLALSRETAPALIARAALARFGEQLPNEMIGEWSLLHRDSDGRLTMVMATARRDPLFYAIRGNRIAIAPDLFRLAKIEWIDAELNEAGLLFHLARAGLRGARGDSTMLGAVKTLKPATLLTIAPDGAARTQTVIALQPQPRWQGSFDDAMHETEQLLRKIMRERMARVARPVVWLSGGLDSSLLAWLAAEEYAQGQDPVSFTSVAPLGSGLPDEAAFADIVANHLGLSTQHIAPDVAANAYRPPDHILGGANGPMLSNRHCLTEAFQIAAREIGSAMMISGTFGEMSVTGNLPSHDLRHQLRGMVVQLRNRLVRSREAGDNPAPFHVRLAPGRMATLPDEIAHGIAHPVPIIAPPKPGTLLGYVWGAEKALPQGNEFYPGAARTELPYRDVRLLRLFAGFPVKMLMEGGHDRPVVRKILDGRLPDSIRLRTRGMPAAPDHFLRLQRQAETARERITVFRKAEVDEWLDLDWLDGALARLGTGGSGAYQQANEVQLTVLAAEFLTWWRTRF